MTNGNERAKGKGRWAAAGWVTALMGLVMTCACGPVQAATVTLGWDAVTTNADGSAISDLSGYQVFYATYSLLGMTTTQAMASGSVARPAFAGNVLTQAVGSLPDGTTLYFRLAAQDQAGNYSGFNVNGSGADVEVSTCTPPAAPPTAPGTPTLTVLSSTQIKLDWTDATGETGYRVERSLDGVAFSTPAGAGSLAANTVTYTNGSLSASTTYYYRVVAKNAAGETASGVSNATTSAAPVTPPSAPTSPMAVAVSTSQITMSWTDGSNNEDGFKIERSLSQGSGYVQIATAAVGPGTGTVMTYADMTGLSAGTTYFYRVRAYDAAGNSGYTPVVSARTLPAAGGVGGTGVGAAPAGLKEAYAYPNPAVGVDPTLRGFMGGVDEMEVTIFDAAGRVAANGRTTTQVTVNGASAFEYRWTGPKPPGVYYAVLHGKKGNQTIRARAKFAVVR